MKHIMKNIDDEYGHNKEFEKNLNCLKTLMLEM